MAPSGRVMGSLLACRHAELSSRVWAGEREAVGTFGVV